MIQEKFNDFEIFHNFGFINYVPCESSNDIGMLHKGN